MAKFSVGAPFNQGLRTNFLPPFIDNDNFPVLINAYQWRGRVKRKRGVALLGRLRRWIGTTDGAGNAVITILPIPIGEGKSNFIIGDDIFTDPGGASPVALLTNSAGSGTLDRATGVLTITGSQINEEIVYLPGLPVMGLETLQLNPMSTEGMVTFDTKYAYNINTNFPYVITDISWYKNPAVNAALPNYVPKTTWTPVSWNGEDYQQFWTTNYAGAFWATNGIKVPFSINNIGMQFNTITAITIDAAGPPAQVTITTGSNHGLVIGDFVFLNEITGMTGINFQSGYVIATPAANQIQVELPNATVAGVYAANGIVQYLTNRIDSTLDCIRFYDGDPTNSGVPPTFVEGNGWVNYCPPLSEAAFSIANLPAAQYYLVGARLIVPFKDRLLFFGPVVQTSSAGSQVYLQDTVIYSQNGTPYYTTSYTNDPSAAADTPTSITIDFNPILVPSGQTATAPAMFEDQVGFGGFLSAGVSDAITSVGSNEDVLIVGFYNKLQTRLVPTGNVVPFEFFFINSEMNTTSTFSAIDMDQGVISRGNRGFIITSQTNTQRIDLQIIDQVFEVNLANNGTERITAVRDYLNEWIYMTYNADEFNWRFPNQTLLYNYRDQSWGLFNESYTTYGIFKKTSGQTWATLTYDTWQEWTSPWNAGDSQIFLPDVVAGNQQGFVVFRDDGTQEDESLMIQNISGSTVTSPYHGLNNGDYIIINDVNGAIGSQVNGNIFSIANAQENSFTLNPNLTADTYAGSGTITRLYVPQIQSKQFPLGWSEGRKTRIGPQQYLFTKTDLGQVTLQIFLSQDGADPYNDEPIYPNPSATNNALIYSQLIYTCPESTNLGLTPVNTNLQMIAKPGATAGTGGTSGSARLWHRVNTSMIGDTIQLGITLDDEQMRDPDFKSQFAEIEFHGFTMDVTPAGYLA